MRWQIEEFVFCDQQQSLTRGTEVKQLEPILVELLSYFCHHPDNIISRNALIEAVWLGRTVTDNAVNRAITKLRRALGDEPQAPRFIATFPKKGYKFIAPVAQLEPETMGKASHKDFAQPADVPKSVEQGKTIRWRLATFVFVALAAFWFFHQDDAPEQLTQVKPLTREKGQEWHPRVSPDQRYLSYTEVVDNKMHLFIKQLSDGHSIEVSPFDDPLAWIGPASWNTRGDKIVYLVASRHYCRYYIQSFDALQLGDPILIHNCPAGSYGKIAFTHDDDLLVFAERQDPTAPYALFSFNLTTGKKRKLNQPPLVLAGNLSFDLHPEKNTLLVSSVDEQMWEGFYAVDLNSDDMTLLFKLDSYVCCGIWDHSGERVVVMGEHPATELVSYDLKGGDRQVVYAGSQQLYAPQRHVNGQDYLFPTGSSNLDIHILNLTSGESRQVSNTTVDDRLATVNPAQDTIAYIGLASGSEEVWLSKLDGKGTRQVSRFDGKQHFVSLAWSPDGETLAALTLNKIYVIDSKQHTSRALKIPQTEIRALSYRDERTLYYSVRQGEQWRIKKYDLTTDEVTSVDQRWQFVRFDARSDDTLWLDQQNQVFQGVQPKSVNVPSQVRSSVMMGANFNLRRFAGHWYWQQWDTDHYVLYSLTDGQTQPSALIRTDSAHFDFCREGLLYQAATGRNTDIFRTVATQ